ncbi:MAG: MFS transporter [Pseudomonadota bacterium]
MARNPAGRSVIRSTPAAPPDNELSRHWRIVVACCVGVGAGTTGIPFYTMGLFVGPLETEFGWSRAAIQLWLTILLLGAIVFVPASGWLADRYGVRRVAIPSLLAVSGVLMLIGGLTGSLFGFYFGSLLLAAAGAGTSPLTWTRAINGWFDRQRGIALGLALSGTGIAAFLAPVYVGWILTEASWRLAYAALGLLPLLALPIVHALLAEPAASARTSGPGRSSPGGVDLPEALRDYRFWLIATAFFFVSAGISGSISNLPPLLQDQGMSAAAAGRIAGIVGLAVIGGRILAGFLLDRFWAPAVAAVMLAAPALSAWILGQPELNLSLVPVAAVLLGLAAGAEFDFIAYLCSRYFGLAHYGKIYGIQYAVFAAGAATAPPLFGYMYDTVGSYADSFLLVSVLFVIGAGLLPLLGRYPDLPRRGAAAD